MTFTLIMEPTHPIFDIQIDQLQIDPLNVV